MPTIEKIRAEIQGTSPSSAADLVRRKYLRALHRVTRRPTVVYASAWTEKPGAPPDALQINRQDVQGFMQALVGIKGTALDLIVHSPGGSAEATEQIVNYLRGKFTDLRVVVPTNAMSAATMLACAANEIVLGKHSALGPIDPQLTLPMGDRMIAVAAQSVLDEWGTAQTQINAPGTNPLLWAEKVRQLPSGFLVECHKAILLSRQLVTQWLEQHMFAGEQNASAKAEQIGEWLGDNKSFLTHGRSIGSALASRRGLRVVALENDQRFQEAVLSVFHATIATFHMTTCCKLIENHNGVGSFTLVAPAVMR